MSLDQATGRSPAARTAATLRLLAVPGAAVLLGWAACEPWSAVRRPAPGRPARVEDLVALVAAGGAALVLAGVTLITAVTLVAAVTGRAERAWARAAARLTPAAVRRLAEVGLGIALAGSPATLLGAAPALAVPAPAHVRAGSAPGAPPELTTLLDRPAPGPADQSAPAPGWRPERPSATRRVAPPPVGLVAAAPRPARAARDTVVVRRGDTLWGITARWLGPGATAAAVAGHWPRWYAANRAVIGPDPALLLPGQQLHPPASPDPH